MKKTYLTPSVKVRKVKSDGILAASPTISGDTGSMIGTSSSDKPATGSTGRSKSFILWDDQNEFDN